MEQVVKILGTRGSIPVSGAEFHRYGGATSCVFLRLAGQAVLLDGGTGLLEAEKLLTNRDAEVPMLLSHPHADHLMGLPMSGLLTSPARKLQLFTSPRLGLSGEEQLKRLMSPPLWPVGPDQLPSPPAYYPVTERFFLGNVRVDTMEGSHPGGVTLFRLSGGGKCVVYVTDCDLQGAMMEKVADFAEGCDLLLCDGQFSPAEWPRYSTFGHSSWEMAARLGEVCGAGQTRIIHHAPNRTDDQLDAAADAVGQKFPNCKFAFEGEEIFL